MPREKPGKPSAVTSEALTASRVSQGIRPSPFSIPSLEKPGPGKGPREMPQGVGLNWPKSSSGKRETLFGVKAVKLRNMGY